MPEIIADVEDAFRWLRGDGAKACRLDASRVVVTGGSAGGYLTLMTGVAMRPRPTALVAYWGYGDLDGDWYTKPSDFYRKHVPLIDRTDASKGVAGKVITGSEDEIDMKARGQFYHYLRQNGLWTKEVTGLDPVKGKSSTNIARCGTSRPNTRQRSSSTGPRTPTCRTNSRRTWRRSWPATRCRTSWSP